MNKPLSEMRHKALTSGGSVATAATERDVNWRAVLLWNIKQITLPLQSAIVNIKTSC